jgi:hypothetical protein
VGVVQDEVLRGLLQEHRDYGRAMLALQRVRENVPTLRDARTLHVRHAHECDALLPDVRCIYEVCSRLKIRVLQVLQQVRERC